MNTKEHSMKYLLPLLIFAASANAFGATVGVRNFIQSWDYLSQATGVDPNTPALRDYYDLAKTRLPKLGVVEELTPLSLLSTTALTGMFCAQMVKNDQALVGDQQSQRRAHRDVNFSKGATELTDLIQGSVIESYTSLFWARSPSNEEMQILKELFHDLVANASSTTEGLLPVLTGACTAVATSLESIQF
jgi:hypothetical protein